MGELLLQSEVTPRLLNIVDMWLGRMPGRLSLMAVAGGTILSVMSGASVASVAMLGKTLVPEMEKKGYKKTMTLGPILGSGGLAIMIPPSGLAILLGSIGEIQIGALLIAIIIPGILMAILYAAYIIISCKLNPTLAPPYEVDINIPKKEKIFILIRDFLPIVFVVFMVTGIIFLGIATPTEAAATGVIGVLILLAVYRKLNRKAIIEAVLSTLKTTGMLFLIIAGAKSFASILGYTGALKELIYLTTTLDIAPLMVVIIMMIIGLILGSFMEPASIMMITLPIFVPIIKTLGFNPVWFGVLFLLNIEVGLTTPPFGLNLFVMKGVAPEGTTTLDIYKAAFPYVVADLIVMVLLIAFPIIALWLPSMM